MDIPINSDKIELFLPFFVNYRCLSAKHAASASRESSFRSDVLFPLFYDERDVFPGNLHAWTRVSSIFRMRTIEGLELWYLAPTFTRTDLFFSIVILRPIEMWQLNEKKRLIESTFRGRVCARGKYILEKVRWRSEIIFYPQLMVIAVNFSGNWRKYDVCSFLHDFSYN